MASAVHIRESIQALDKEFAIHDVRLLGVVSRTIFTAALIRNGGHTQQSDMLADQFMIDSDTSDFVDYRAFMNYLDDLAEEVGRMGLTPTVQPNASPQVASTTLPTASRSPSTSQPAAILSQPVKQDEQHGSLTQRRPSPSPTPSSTASRVSIAVAARLKSGSSSQYIDVEASCSPATPVPPAGGRGASREAQHNEARAMNDAKKGTYHRMLYHNADIELAETVSKVEDNQRGGPSPPPRPVTLPGFDGPMAAMAAPTAILSQSPSSPFSNTVALSSVGSDHISQVTQLGIAAATAPPTVISNPQPAPPSNEATPKRAQSDYKSTRMLEDSPTYAISELSATPTPMRPQPPGETLLEAQRRLEYTASYFVPSDGANAMSPSPAINTSTRARSRDGLAAPDQLYAYLARPAATSYAAGQSHQPAPPAQNLNTSWRASIRPEAGGSESRKQLATTYPNPSENYFYVPPTVEDERPHESIRAPPTLCPADRSILDPSRADSRLLYNTAIERFWSDEKAIRPIQEVNAEQPSPSLVVMSPTKSVSPPQLRVAIPSPKIAKLPLETVFDIIASSSLSTNTNNSAARSTVTLPVVHRCLHSERGIPHTSYDELAAVISSLGLGEEEPLGLSDFCMFVSRLRPEAIAGLRDPRYWQLQELAKPLVTAPQQGWQMPFEACSSTRPAHESLLQSVSSPTLLESTVTGRQLQGQMHAASDLWASSATNNRSPSAPSPARSAPPKPLLDSHKPIPHSEKPYPLQPTNSSWSEGISDLDGHDGLQAQGSGTQWVVDRPEDFHSYQHSQGTSSIRRAERNNALAALAGMVEQDTIQTGRHASRSRSMEILSARSSQSPDSYFMMPSGEPHDGPTKVLRRFKRVSGDDPSARNRSHSSRTRAVELRPQVAIRNPKPRPDTTALGQDKMTGQAVVLSSSRLLKPTESFRQRTRSAIEDKQPTGAATISRRVVDTVPLHGPHASRFGNPTASSTFNVPLKTSSRIEADTSALKVAGALGDVNAASTNTVQRSGLVSSFSSDPPLINQPSTEVVHIHYHDPVAIKGYAAGQMRLPAQATIRERSSLQSKTDVANGGGRKAAAPPQRFLGDIPVNTIDLTNGSSLHPSGSRSKASAATTSMSASRSRNPSPSPRAPAGTNISSVRSLFDGQKGVASVPIKREELFSASVKPTGHSISIPIQGPISLSQKDKGRSPVPSDDTITTMCGTLLSLCSANDPRQLGEVGLRAFNTALHSAVSEMSAPDYQKDQLLEWLVDSVRDYIVVSSDPHASSHSAISSPAQQASCRYLEYLSYVVNSWPSQAQILFAAHVEASKSQKGVGERQKIDNRARKAEVVAQQRHQLHSNTVADARENIVGQVQVDSSLAEATAKMHKLIRLELSSALGAGTSGREGLALLGATLTDAFTRNDVSRSGYADEKVFRRVLLGLYLPPPRGSATVDPPATNMPSWVMDRCVKIAKEPFAATEALPSSLLKMAYLAAVKAEEEGRVPHGKRHSTCDYRYFMRVLRL